MRPNIVFAFADDWGRYASAYDKFGKKGLNEKLMKVLKKQNDPRICETPCRYEHAPFTCIDN